MNITIFTDGSLIKYKNGTVYAGYGVYFPNKEFSDVSEPFLIKPLTNQRTELYAIYTGIKQIIEGFDFKIITVYSDSEYSIKTLSKWAYEWEKNNWRTSNKKEAKNLDLIKPLFKIIKKYKGRINLVHVKSHTNKTDDLSIGNSFADKLAVSGAKESKYILYEKKEKVERKQSRAKKSNKRGGDIELNYDYSKIELVDLDNSGIKTIIMKE
jgi:ribonuclease HI